MTIKKRQLVARKGEADRSASMWAVMRAQSLACIEINGIPMRATAGGPCRFIPLFETRAQAVAWDNGCEDHVREVQPNTAPSVKTCAATEQARAEMNRANAGLDHAERAECSATVGDVVGASEGGTMETKNAVITSAKLTCGDRGFLDCWLNLDYGGAGQAFGGYVLYLPKSFANHELMSCAGHFVFRVMEVAGVTDWEDLKGKTIRVKADHSHVEAIGHIVKNDWFCPSRDLSHNAAGQTPADHGA